MSRSMLRDLEEMDHKTKISGVIGPDSEPDLKTAIQDLAYYLLPGQIRLVSELGLKAGVVC